ncbi:MAG TPA: hypothetical protein DIU15_07080, partial [Deltaproteobacteria bacterium]|nr:hypothetical protein [Deltaproteobacteria bacterium]
SVGEGNTESLVVSLVPGAQYAVGVESFDETESPYVLDVLCAGDVAEECGNWVDDDGDGDVDCDDSECLGDPYCVFELCGNGFDDDADGLIDCLDSDCADAPDCGNCHDDGCHDHGDDDDSFGD